MIDICAHFVQVQLLADENKELRWMLRFRCSSCSNHINSPLLGKGVRFITTLHGWHKCSQALGVYSNAAFSSQMCHWITLSKVSFSVICAEHIDQLDHRHHDVLAASIKANEKAISCTSAFPSKQEMRS